MCPPVKHFCADLFQPCQIGSLRFYPEKGLDFPRRKFPLEGMPNKVYSSLTRRLTIFCPMLENTRSSERREHHSRSWKQEIFPSLPITPVLPIQAAFCRRKSFLWKPFGFFDSFSMRRLQGQGPQNATHGDRDSSPGDPLNARAGAPTGPSPAARRPPRWLSTATRPTRPN
jgi:hypothetical protein